MITEKQIQEFREALESSKNPLFFFDDDPDGFTAFILFYKKYQKGKFIPVKAPPHEEDIYLKKIEEYNPDKIFILDRPIITQNVVDSARVPIYMLDHHEPLKLDGKHFHYFNPRVNNNEDNRPTSYWAYRIVNDFMWIAAVGIFADWHIPDFAEDFSKQYPDILPKGIHEQGKVLYETPLGILVRFFSSLLKGPTSEVKKCIKIFSKIESPYEILNQTTPQGKFLYERFKKIDKEYKKLIDEALKTEHDKNLFVFIYPSTKISFTGSLSNELMYRLDAKVIIIGRRKDDFIRLSIRSSKIKIAPLLKKALQGIEGYGGGHDYACGASVVERDFERFLENFRSLMD